jgi:hypothetical protein
VASAKVAALRPSILEVDLPVRLDAKDSPVMARFPEAVRLARSDVLGNLVTARSAAVVLRAQSGAMATEVVHLPKCRAADRLASGLRLRKGRCNTVRRL